MAHSLSSRLPTENTVLAQIIVELICSGIFFFIHSTVFSKKNTKPLLNIK